MTASSPGPVRRRAGGGVARLVLAGAAVAGSLWAGSLWGERMAVASWRQRASHQAELYAAGLESALARYDYIPRVLALHPAILELLRQPGDRAHVGEANRYLERLNEETGAGDLYLMDPSGRVLAASNWQAPLSFVETELSYRPYFQDAMRLGQGRFYGIGTTNGVPGYYFAVAIRDGERVAGVAVAKVSLERIEAAWAPGDERVFVTDGQGVIVLSSVPAWKFRVTTALSEPVLTTITQTRQYASVNLKPLPLVDRAVADAETRVVSLGGEGEAAAEYLAHARALAGTGWRMTVLSPRERFAEAARSAALVGGLAGGLLLLTLLYARQRRVAFRQQQAAQAALQRANDALEERVAARTAALRAAQAELIQKEKLAVLGQMAVGIVHELNQPLAAMRMMTDNAAAFLRRNQPEDAQDTLGLSSRLIDRMGNIIGPLRAFAHRSSDPVPCLVRVCVANALLPVNARIRQDGVLVDCTGIPERLTVLGDPGRFEQVLLNLLSNALDAMAGHGMAGETMTSPTGGRLTVSARCEGARAVIQVRDSGPGIPPEVAERLFEPFFTTKPVGKGLGLGLVISAAIVGEFGGVLRHTPDDGGGCVFTLDLPLAPAPLMLHPDETPLCQAP